MKEAGKGGVADARELKPMVGGAEEVAALHEFHFHYLSLSVLTDCTSSGDAFVTCITQDMLLFLFLCLPITWMAELVSQLRPPSVKVSWKEQRLCQAQGQGWWLAPVRTGPPVFWLSVFSCLPTGHWGACLKQQFIPIIVEGDHGSSFQLAKVHVPPFLKKRYVLFTLLSYLFADFFFCCSECTFFAVVVSVCLFIWFGFEFLSPANKEISINSHIPSW